MHKKSLIGWWEKGRQARDLRIDLIIELSGFLSVFWLVHPRFGIKEASNLEMPVIEKKNPSKSLLSPPKGPGKEQPRETSLELSENNCFTCTKHYLTYQESSSGESQFLSLLGCDEVASKCQKERTWGLKNTQWYNDWKLPKFDKTLKPTDIYIYRNRVNSKLGQTKEIHTNTPQLNFGKLKKKILKNSQGKMTLHLYGKISSSNSRFLIRNHGGQKEVAQYFSCAKRKEMSTPNPIFRENTLQEWRKSRHLLDEGNLRDSVTSKLTLKNG